MWTPIWCENYDRERSISWSSHRDENCSQHFHNKDHNTRLKGDTCYSECDSMTATIWTWGQFHQQQLLSDELMSNQDLNPRAAAEVSLCKWEHFDIDRNENMRQHAWRIHRAPYEGGDTKTLNKTDVPSTVRCWHIKSFRDLILT